MRFRVFILFPIIFVGSVALATLTASWSETTLAIVVFASSLQLGYVCTLLLRPTLVSLGGGVRLPFLGSPTLR
ncbi:hypothetical protein HY68_37425 [Streptomyces sp. AcH 505]|nr:hypothetical protein HY68_37425 [Streptomyces sp. AcH 505]